MTNIPALTAKRAITISGLSGLSGLSGQVRHFVAPAYLKSPRRKFRQGIPTRRHRWLAPDLYETTRKASP